ncbi:hypothetical protein N9Y89_01140 [bacterium]|nr:hypothetical protein [bacterium]
MSFLIVGAIGVAAGAAKAISGGVKKKRAKEDAAEARKQMEAEKEKYAAMDTTNLYANMENTMEDLTVNQEEAQFMKQQQQQNQANIMANMKASAGSSGIAGLAQTLANQGSLDAQRSAISIGKQEAANQKAERAEASRLQGLEIGGEYGQRQDELDKISTFMGMAGADAASAEARKAAADEQMWSGISGAVGSASGGITDKLGM